MSHRRRQDVASDSAARCDVHLACHAAPHSDASEDICILRFSGDAQSDARRLRALVTKRPPTVAVITAGANAISAQDAVSLMRAGAFDVVLTPVDNDDLQCRLAEARAEARRRRARHDAWRAAVARLSLLTPRERDVANELIAGASNKVAARRLDLSPRTVEFHRARIFSKLDISSVAQLARLALTADAIGSGPIAEEMAIR